MYRDSLVESKPDTMVDRMGASQPLLLQPRCPAQDDPVVLDLLRLVMATSGAAWVELELVPEGGSPARTFSLGKVSDAGHFSPIAVGGDFKAKLRVGSEKPLAEEFVGLLGLGLTRALECSRLREQITLLRGALDTTSSSVLLFDDRGDIVYANPPADRLLSLQTEDELLADTNGASVRPLFSLLCTLVERVAAGDGASASWKGTLDLADSRVMVCEVMRIPQARDDAQSAVLVLLQPVGAGPEARVDAFSENHGLSPREREVVHLLVQGLTTVVMADRLGISPHTVRDHLKHLYRKTGTNSRSELLGLIAGAAQPTFGDGDRVLAD